MIHGVDTWQAYRVDWPALRAAGFPFAYLRCTVGSDTVDAKYAESVEQARDAGVLIGAYVFLYLNRDVEPQIAHFLKHCKDVGAAGDLPPAIDLEAPWDWRKVGARVTLDRVLTAARMLDAHFGRRPVAYTSSGWWANLDAIAGANLEDRAYLASCPLWAAAYHLDPWLPAEGHVGPKFGPWARSTFHQFSGDHSVPIPAVKSDGCPRTREVDGRQVPWPHVVPCQRVDRDVWFGTEDELRAFALVPPDEAVTTPVLPESVTVHGRDIVDEAIAAYRRDFEGHE